jgi:hypothetical protein
MAQLTLHNVYSRFRNDMFLSSLSESGPVFETFRIES